MGSDFSKYNVNCTEALPYSQMTRYNQPQMIKITYVLYNKSSCQKLAILISFMKKYEIWYSFFKLLKISRAGFIIQWLISWRLLALGIVSSGSVKLMQKLVWVIADIRGNFWPDLGLEIADLGLQSEHLGANCVCLKQIWVSPARHFCKKS